MTDFDFNKIGVMIADDGRQIRTEIKSILHREGFREMVDTDDMTVIRDAVEANEVDLLIADHALPSGDVCQLLRDIRNHRLGDNPFIVIVTLVQDPSKEQIMSIIDAGSDDLVLKPITADTLIKRMKYLVAERKKFVVTSNYIGPTRRSAHRPGTMEIPEFDVPNPVKIKASGDVKPESYQKVVDSFINVLNEQKIERNAFQVTYLVDEIMPLYQAGAYDEISDKLKHLLYISQDTGRRLKDTKYDHVGDLCETLLTVVNRICLRPKEPESKDLELMQKMSQAISAAINAEGADADIARSISESVKRGG